MNFKTQDNCIVIPKGFVVYTKEGQRIDTTAETIFSLDIFAYAFQSD